MKPVITSGEGIEESAASRRRRRARQLALIMLGTAAGGALAGAGLRMFSMYRAARALADSSDWTTLSDLKTRGIIPQSSTVLKPSVVKKETDYSSLAQRIRRFIGLDKTNGAEGSAYLANTKAIPLFFLGNDIKRVNERIAKHEGGHYAAQKARGNPADYVREYGEAKERAGGWLDVFRPGRLRDGKGRLTLVGLENEAWDRGGVPKDDTVRRAAVGTYATDGAVRSLNRYMKLTAAASVVPGVMGLGSDGDKKKDDNEQSTARS